MLDFGFYNMDCMDGMKEFPDKYFDLAIVDPPYGINVGQMNSEERTHSAGEIQVGGGFFTTPKFTRRSTTATRRTPHISKN